MDTAALRPAPQVVIPATTGLRDEQKVTAIREQLTHKSPTYRALTADPFAVLAPAEPDLPF